MFTRRAQGISWFILLGFGMMAIFLLYFFVSGLEVKIPTISSSNALGITSYMQSCIQEVGSFGLFVLGRQGGYIEEPEPYHWETFGAIGYAFLNTQNTLLPKEQMELNLAAYITEELPQCLNNFEGFEEQGIEVHANHITTTVLFAQEEVIVNVQYPLKIQEERATRALDSFRTQFPVRMAHLYEIAYTLMEKKETNPGFLDITFLSSLDVESTVLTDAQGEQVIVFEDPQSQLLKKPFKFLIATREEIP